MWPTLASCTCCRRWCPGGSGAACAPTRRVPVASWNATCGHTRASGRTGVNIVPRLSASGATWCGTAGCIQAKCPTTEAPRRVLQGGEPTKGVMVSDDAERTTVEVSSYRTVVQKDAFSQHDVLILCWSLTLLMPGYSKTQ